VSGPIWLRWVLTVAGIALAAAHFAEPIRPRSARRGPPAARRTGFLAAAWVTMPLGMAAMASPVGDPARTRDATLALGALTAGLGAAARWPGRAEPAAAVAFGDWLTVALSGAAMVLAAVAGHGAGAPVELAAVVPPLTYPCVRTAVRAIGRARSGSLLRDGGELATSAGMIYMLLTML
jgi:hypothetical protein